MLMAGDLEMGHARALLALAAAQQILAAHEIVAKKLSVREAERLVSAPAGVDRSPAAARSKPSKPRDLARLEEQLSDR